MTCLKSLKLNYFRNITDQSLIFSDRFNLIYGENGSGKTSVLEAIYLLSNGKSFRSSQKAHIIQHQQAEFTVFAEVLQASGLTEKIALQKKQTANARLLINGQVCRALSTAAELLPVVLIDPNSYGLVEEGPGYRRQYIDWLLFHVKHDYNQLYANYHKALKQRNAALKQSLPRKECIEWDHLLIELGEQIGIARRDTLTQLTPIFNQLISELNFGIEVSLSYQIGWNSGLTLAEALQATLAKDLILGYTSVGPQRADICFSVNNCPAADVLSRGQEKLVVACLLISQALYYENDKDNSPIYLLDDFSSELDDNNRNKFFSMLSNLNGQFILTATSKQFFPDNLMQQSTMFHVKHGVIS
jgi:DNA replication and repair protein RecF